MRINIQSNTPLRKPPQDYCPSGSDRWFSIPRGIDAGKKLFYYDHVVGTGTPEATVVFVHGNPENSYTYRHIRNALMASGHNLRLVAMDHIGFGLSGQATFEMVDMHHSANLLQLIQHLNLNKVTLVVHDWGGPIGIGAFIQEPVRVCALAVLNSTIFPMPDDGFTYANFPITWFPWCVSPKVVPDFLWGGVAGYVVSHASPQGTVKFLVNVVRYLFQHGCRLIPEGSPEYVWAEALRSRSNAKSSKRNVLQTPYWGHGYGYLDPVLGRQNNHVYYDRMQKALPIAWGVQGRAIPVCGYFGEWDACGKASVVRQWQHALPQMTDFTFRYENVGHFIEEYKGDEIARSILKMNHLT